MEEPAVIRVKEEVVTESVKEVPQVREHRKRDENDRKRQSSESQDSYERRHRHKDHKKHSRRRHSSSSRSDRRKSRRRSPSSERDRRHRRRRSDNHRHYKREERRSRSRTDHRGAAKRDQEETKERKVANQRPEDFEQGTLKGETKTQKGALLPGGVYIPPFKLRKMMEDLKNQEKTSLEHQKYMWEMLRKSINGIVNKVNTSNIQNIILELFNENLLRGKGLLARAIMKAQMASPNFTHVYAALIAVINTKLPAIVKILVERVLIQF